MTTFHRAAWRRAAAAAALGLASTTAVAAVSGPAASAPDDQCPEAFPVADLVAGQAVDGLTVTRGTEPVPFTGEVLGVIEDGIAPGIDMIMAEMTSDVVDAVGIWQGMSGSPVYSEDGRLVGAVAYGLTWGPSPVAGITPAAAMYDLLATDGAAPAPAPRVAVTQAQARRIDSRTQVTARQASQGFSQLPMPLGVSGMSPARLAKATEEIEGPGGRTLFGGQQVRAVGGASRSLQQESVPMAPGGNFAASASYGDVSAVGVGTTTAVCGDQALAFGHPAMFAGPTSMTMHGADAVYVQADPVGPGFKVANPTAPSGTVSGDRMAGLVGQVGPVPGTTPITSVVRHADGSAEREGATQVSVQRMVPDIAASHLLVNQDRVFDGIRDGSARIAWTFTGTAPDGSPWTITREDSFIDRYDITFAAPWRLFEQLWVLQRGLGDRGTIDSVTMDATLAEDVRVQRLQKVEVRRGKQWQAFDPKGVVRARPGDVLTLRATLSQPGGGTAQVPMTVTVPRGTLGRSGALFVQAGSQMWRGQKPEGVGFARALDRVAKMPYNSELVATLALDGRPAVERRASITRDDVVRGSARVRVRVVR